MKKKGVKYKMDAIYDLFAMPKFDTEVIASKSFEYGGTTVTAEMSIMRDESGEVVNGSCYAYYNGIFHHAQDYQDAIRIAKEIIDTWKQGKDYEGGT